MLLRPFLNDATSCASYLVGRGTHAKLAVVDPHADLVDDYLATAAALGCADRGESTRKRSGAARRPWNPNNTSPCPAIAPGPLFPRSSPRKASRR